MLMMPLPMLEIIIGMTKGETREGDFWRRTVCSRSSVASPPMPLPTMAPKRVRSTVLRSTPLSAMAMRLAAMARPT